MDLKTLEYMEDRAKEARKLVEKIDQLTKKSEKMSRSGQGIALVDERGSGHEYFDDSRNSRLYPLLRSAIQKLIAEEIAKLESELAEL